MLIFLVGLIFLLLGVLMGGGLCVGYLRREIAGRRRPETRTHAASTRQHPSRAKPRDHHATCGAEHLPLRHSKRNLPVPTRWMKTRVSLVWHVRTRPGTIGLNAGRAGKNLLLVVHASLCSRTYPSRSTARRTEVRRSGGTDEQRRAVSVHPITLQWLEAFYVTEYPKLVKTLVLLDARIEEAEDAAQKAMADFTERSRTNNLPAHPAAYVQRAAINFFIKERQRERERLPGEVQGGHLAACVISDRQDVVVAGASSAGDADVGEQGHHLQA